jgi:hypothetical protein
MNEAGPSAAAQGRPLADHRGKIGIGDCEKGIGACAIQTGNEIHLVSEYGTDGTIIYDPPNGNSSRFENTN